MNIKSKLRTKIRQYLGITTLERTLLTTDITRQLELRAIDTAAEFVEKHMLNAKVVHSALEAIDFALSKIDSPQKGLFCEFGVFTGGTVNHIARQIRTTIYGFDSFQGLPDHWREGYPRGAFARQTLPKCEPNVELVVGWFEETLPAFVAAHPEPVIFLHIDCDLYSSTKTIFHYLGERLAPNALIVFNEYFNYPGWQQHEHRALCEFVEESGRQVEYVCYNRYHEQVVVLVR